MIGRFVRNRRRGALAMVALAAIVPVTGMMAANLNTSQMIDDRRQSQDAADALASVHAAWTARSLNIIAMNNVTTAQLLSVAVGSEALIVALSELTGRAGASALYIAGHGATHCPARSPNPIAYAVESAIWTAPCGVWHTAVGLPATLAITRAERIKDEFDPAHGLETATKALKAIDGMNKALAQRHPRAMAEIAESHHPILEIDDHHFADPCSGAMVRNCTTANTGDGMALPLVEASASAYAHLALVMAVGMTSKDTTFRARGFDPGRGPIQAGGSRGYAKLVDHINHVTEIGVALHDFKRFYSSSISDLPRHPAAGPGTAQGPIYNAPPEQANEEIPFDDETTSNLEGLEDFLEGVTDITEDVLTVLRRIPLQYDRHPQGLNLAGTQSIRGSNSFRRYFSIAHGMVALGPRRDDLPLVLDLTDLALRYPAPVPQIFELEGIDPTDLFPPLENLTMPEAFHILAFSQKEMSRRLGGAELPSPVKSHSGYGQAGVFNPDGASLYSQNWHMRLMPATRMDDIRQASRDLDRQATASFDDVARDLGNVASQASWDRVNAH
jgi:hypothetical protein